MAELRSITEVFAHDDPACSACRGEGQVCATTMTYCAMLGTRECPPECCAEGAPCPAFMASHA
jgi:hypothetical protein